MKMKSILLLLTFILSLFAVDSLQIRGCSEAIADLAVCTAQNCENFDADEEQIRNDVNTTLENLLELDLIELLEP